MYRAAKQPYYYAITCNTPTDLISNRRKRREEVDFFASDYLHLLAVFLTLRI